MDAELHEEIITLLGVQRVIAVYEVVGGQPVSFATLQRIILHGRVREALDQGKHPADITSQLEVSLSTVKRIRTRMLRGK